jgi:hypothetical protein
VKTFAVPEPYESVLLTPALEVRDENCTPLCRTESAVVRFADVHETGDTQEAEPFAMEQLGTVSVAAGVRVGVATVATDA